MNAPLRILVIEDESLIRWSLRNCLQKLGLEVLEADTGEAGLALLAGNGIAAVLLDMRLPGISGLEVLKQLRLSHPVCQVWIMTAHGTPEAEAEARSLGVEDFMAKPFDCKELADRVFAALAA